MSPFATSSLKCLIGIIGVTLSALLLAAFSGHTSFRNVLPWVFILVVIAFSARFGAPVSLVGSILAALIFARLVYAPIGSVRVADQSSRADLVWMVLIAVAVSYLLFPRHPRDSGQQ